VPVAVPAAVEIERLPSRQEQGGIATHELGKLKKDSTPLCRRWSGNEEPEEFS
jgi:hypothetical protein